MEKDENYLYFFHGTASTDAQSFFDKGLISYLGPDLRNTAWQYSESMGKDINESMRDYVHNIGFHSLVLIKIPKKMLGSFDENGNPNLPLPIWKWNGEEDLYGRKIATLPSEFILGMYQKDETTGMEHFIDNPNYSTEISPNGLQYDESAYDFYTNYLQVFPEFEEFDAYIYERGKHTYDELLESDLLTRPFDGFYRQKGIIQGIDIENMAEKQNLSGIHAVWKKFKNWINRTFKSQQKYLNDGHQNNSQERIDF